ncbi:preprotein translocase subunit SecE [Terasakiispira papahanaumokuakeensis]|uniref:Protein translocase subunit SecE n=1 Tax=Terasakiispira papahanaumokuakeensis TaxID=197479 RepID=A0A1E2VCC3_9GAMM|nr:preprotein translocase subunit SecE [Terasakiispira papahanaumokuakeensis]ODC04668.1 preprotein translocase subunit SecE [Terasakiispira papahanaumokuakeensis]
MKAKVDAPQTRLDTVKWALVVALIAVAVAGNSYFAAEVSVLYRVLGVVALGAVSAFVALQTAKGQAFVAMAKEARVEIRKVVWPTRPETVQTTLIVLAAVALVGLLLWLVDSLLSWLIKSVIY